MIKDTLYSQYIWEREGAEIIENEVAFIIYKIIDKECMILEMFVDPISRGSNKKREIIEELSSLAIKKGCEGLSGTIDLNAKDASHALSAVLRFGFKVVQAQNNILVLYKKLGVLNG